MPPRGERDVSFVPAQRGSHDDPARHSGDDGARQGYLWWRGEVASPNNFVLAVRDALEGPVDGRTVPYSEQTNLLKVSGNVRKVLVQP